MANNPESQYLAGEREAEIAALRNDPTYQDGVPQDLDVLEMRLCEVTHLILRPNQKYIFTVDPTCEGCVKAAAAAAGN